MNRNFYAEIMANISKFQANIAKAQASADRLQDKVTVNVDADTAAATAQISRFRAMLNSIPNKFRVRADMDTSAMSKMNGLLNNFRGSVNKTTSGIKSAFGEAASEISMMQNALMALAPAAIPVVASLVPVVMAVGNALAVVGGGAIGLAGAFAIAGAGALAFGGLAMSAYQMLQDGTLAATAETYAFTSALASLQSQWAGLVQSNQAGIFTAMANGVNIAKAALTGLTPFIEGVVTGVANASARMLQWVQTSQTASNFFKMMGTTGVQVFNDILAAVGRFGAGFVSLFTQFGPLFSFMAQGLANMGAQFEAWANKVSTAQGIKNFISYVQTNLPLIGQIFGNVFTGIFNLFTAFGTNSQTIFQALAQMSAQFAAWSATIAQSQGFKQFIDYVQTQGPVVMSTIGSIVTAVIAFATAMAPVGAAVLGVVSAIAQWVASFATAHPQIVMVVGAITTFIGAIGMIMPVVMNIVTGIMTMVNIFNMVRTGIQLAAGAFALFTSPIGLAVVAIGLLVAAFVMAYTKVEWFRNAINTFVSGWLSGVQMIIAGVQQFAAGWMAGFQMIIAGIQSFIAGWTAGFQMIISGIQAFVAGWMSGVQMIGQGISMAVSLLTTFGSTVLSIITTAWSGAVTAVSAGWSMITSAISSGVSSAISFVSSGFQSMLSTASSIMSSIVSACSSAFSSVVSAISSGISSAVSFVSSGFSSMLSTASSILSSIVSAVSSAFSAVTSAISSGISAALSAVSSGFSAMVSAASSFASSLISLISSAMSSFVSAIVSGASSALSAITSMCSSILGAIRGVVGQMVSAGADLVRGFIKGIQSMAGAALDAARSMAQNAVNAVKSLLKIGSPSKVLKQIGQWLTQGFAIGIRKDIPKVETAVQRMLRPVTKGLAKLKSRNYEDSRQGASSVYSLMYKNIENATQALDKMRKKREELSKKMRDTKSVKAIAKMRKEYASLGKSMMKQYKVRRTNKNLVAEVRPMLIYMTRIAKKREEIAARLDKAQDKLQEAISRKTDFSAKIRDDLRGYASITSTERKTANGMRKVMAKRLSDMKAYYANIERLKKMGINKSTLKDILDAGIETGGSLAKGLVKGGKSAVNQINSLQSQINSVSSKMGQSNASHFYQAGVDAARGVVNGLKAQDAQLKQVATKIADVVSSTIKKRLGIHSPSRVMMDLMSYVGKGLLIGLNAAAKVSANAASALSRGIESNINPDVQLANIKTAADLKTMSGTVTQEMINDVSAESKQNITIVLRAEHDIPMMKHVMDEIDAVGANINLINQGAS